MSATLSGLDPYRGRYCMRINRAWSPPTEEVFGSGLSMDTQDPIEDFELGDDPLGGERLLEIDYDYGLGTMFLGSQSAKAGSYWTGSWPSIAQEPITRWSDFRHVMITPCYTIDNFEGYGTVSTDPLKPHITTSWFDETRSYATHGEDCYIVYKSLSGVDLSNFNVVSFFAQGPMEIGIRFMDSAQCETPTTFFTGTGMIEVEYDDYSIEIELWNRYEAQIDWGLAASEDIVRFEFVYGGWMTNTTFYVDDMYLLRADRKLLGRHLSFNKEINMNILRIPYRTFERTQIGGRKNVRGQCTLVDLQESDINFVRELKNLDQQVYVRADNWAVPAFVENFSKQFRRVTPDNKIGFDIDVAFIEKNPYEAT